MSSTTKRPNLTELDELFSTAGEYKSRRAMATALDIAETTLRSWQTFYEFMSPENVVQFNTEATPAEAAMYSAKPNEVDVLKDRVRTLEATLKGVKKETLTDHYIREKIIGILAESPEPPKWVVETKSTQTKAVPTLFISDLHWGEVVDSSQIGGVNEYNISIAHERLQALVNTSTQLLDIIGGEYPGIVLAMGGDMFSGSIHEELTETNENDIMPVFLDLYEKLIWMIESMQAIHGKVFIPCVTGNHSRTTMKMRMKGRNFTNYDWLLYCLLDRHFKHDDNVTFLIPNGPDAIFKIYGTRYLLTHGDQFRGGDSMIGALGPLTRGNHKKSSRNAQIDQSYDIMMVGHWHQLIQVQRLIVNGSLKGYDEYAYNNNFGYEQPRQALWLTHPEHGVIFFNAVNVDRHHHRKIEKDWVSWKE